MQEEGNTTCKIRKQGADKVFIHQEGIDSLVRTSGTEQLEISMLQASSSKQALIIS